MKKNKPINAAITLVSNEAVASGIRNEDEIYRELCVKVIQEMPIDRLSKLFSFYSGHYNPPIDVLIRDEGGHDMNYYKVVLNDQDI